MPTTPDARLAELAAHAVGATQRGLPPDLRALARGVIVHYETLPDSTVIEAGFPADILGLFTGPAYNDTSGQEPGTPQIMLYLNNLWDFATEDEAVFKEEVQLTYLHELGHYLGWDEDDVAARGLE
jgi:predicted Zn-dependent protease with MMP-like domain